MTMRNRVALRSTAAQAARNAFDRMTTKPKVVWTHEEKRQIAKYVAEHRIKSPLTATMTLINNAIATLPEERRRVVICVSNVPWLQEMVQEILSGLLLTTETLTKQVNNLGEANEQLRLDAERLKARIAELEAVPDVLKMSSAELLGYYSGAVHTETMAKLSVMETGIIAKVVSSLRGTEVGQPAVVVNNHGPGSVRVDVGASQKKRTKVLIIGGKKEALITIASGVKTAGLDVTFVHRHMDDPKNAAGAPLPRADWTIILAGTVGKQVRDKVLEQVDAESVIMVPGTNANTGLTALLQKLKPSSN